MGILRADRITGLGGANAIKGSVEFTGDGSGGNTKGTSLNIVDANDKADLNFAGNDFTFEAWVFPTANIAFNPIYCQAWGLQIYIDSTSDDNNVKIYVGSNDSGSYAISGATSANGTIKPNAWNHVAFSRSGNSWTIFTNGTAATSSTSSQSLVSSNADYTIGIFNSIGSTNDLGSYFGFNGHISNLRIRTGAHYLPSTNFTPPVGELQKTSDTVLLCCQSSSDSTKEETGKTLVPTSKNTNDKLPTASKFTPNSPVGFSTTTDVGSQYGATFDGFTVFATSTYMVPPGGNTRERGRGRGVLGGGAPFVSPNVLNNMSFVEVQSQGNFQDFGDLTVSRGQFPAGQNASSTRGLSSGGWTSPVGVNTIDFITISNTANAIDFGDTAITRPNAVLSNQTRSLTAGNGDLVNTIDFVTIATTGNASDFGDLVDGRANLSGVSSSTRGVFGGGRNNTPSSNTEYNTLQFITIATTGNTQDFGDLTRTRYGSSGFSSPTRGIFAGGYSNPQGKFEGIEFITIATLGNGTDFGDLTTTQGYGGSLTNSILGLITINNPSNYHNTIDFITISTTGNAKDFGDADPLGSGKGHGTFPSCMSDSHGGTT